MISGKLITLEGIDGAGKSSHIEAIRNLLEARGVSVLATREPGGTEIGEKLRELILHAPMQLDTETLLIFAARSQHLNEKILPALSGGTWVVSDRFTDATYAYQGGGRGAAMSRLALLEEWVQHGLEPDLTLFFDVPVEVGQWRRRQGSLLLDRFEEEDRMFFQRVRAAYLERAHRYPRRIAIIDANRAAIEVNKFVEQTILTNCF